jgi:hypothetical protein
MREQDAPVGERWYASPYKTEHGEPVLEVWMLGARSYFRFRYCDDTEFVVDRRGTRIWATWPAHLTLEDTATYLLGPVLGFVLRLRGITCLHASAIALGGQVIALVGNARAGKSTTTAAFAGLGYPVLSDDIVALSDKGQPPLVQPGYPRVGLWPESVKAIYGSADALPRLTRTWEKRYLDLTEASYRFKPEPLPLAAVYVLSERSHDPAAPSVKAIPLQTGLMALVANTCANHLLDRAMRAQEFASLGRLVTHVPLRRVTPHANLTRLSRLCDTILDDFHGLTSPRPGDERVSAR